VGFFDSFSTGLSNVGSFIGSTLNQFAASPLGGQFVAQVGQFGIGKLADLIGINQVAGSPNISRSLGPAGRPPIGTFGPSAGGPLGTPARVNALQNLSLSQFSTLQKARNQVLGMTGEAQRQALETALFAIGPELFQLTFPNLSQTFRNRPPNVFGPPPTIPASQPFGRQPGDFSGGSQVAFPVTRNQGFPAPSFLPALFSGGGGFQQAGFASALGPLARQLPGIIGGFAGGAALEGLLDGGGGGTPMFRAGMTGARAQFFRTQNPATGQDTWFRPAGRPILWSGDLTACKRVNKVARRARRKR